MRRSFRARAWLGLLWLGTAATGRARADDTSPAPAVPPATAPAPVPAAPAPVAAPKAPDPDPWLDVQGATLTSVSDDGKTVFFRMSRDGITQLFRTGPDGGWPLRLTFRREGVDFAVPSPDGRQVVLGYDHDGDENHGLYLRSTAALTSDERVLEDARTVQHGSVHWSREGDRLFFRSNVDGPADFHLFERRLSDGVTRRLLDRPGMWNIEDVAPGGGRLLVAWEKDVHERLLYVLDVATGALTEIDPRPAGQAASPSDAWFLGAGAEVLFVSDRGGEWSLPWIARLSDGLVRALPVPAADVDALVPTRDGKTVYLVQDDGGRGRLLARDAATGAALPVPDLGDAVAASPEVDAAGDLFFTLLRSDAPAAVVRWDRSSGALIPITIPDMAGLPRSATDFPPRLVEIPTFDGRKVPAWLYLPGQRPAERPAERPAKALPFVLQMHGGPTGQERPTFSAERAYLLAQGYGVLAPNVRGSTGYGKTYRDLDDYKRRLDAVKDAKACADWLGSEGLADPHRLAVVGGSYGGYMVLALLTEYPDAFAAGAESVGIANFETFLERTADYRRANRESEYGPLTDREFLRSISPIHKVDRITAPLLIAHGENDPRVPVGEARQMEKALRDLHRPVDAIYFKDEGHGWSKRSNRRTYLRRLAEFLWKSMGAP